MRKWIAFFLAIMMLPVFAIGETVQSAPDFVMEGFDGDGLSRSWDDNLFFKRMQEQTGISFTFSQYTDWDKWTARKKELAAGNGLPDVLFKAGLTTSEVEGMYSAGVIIDLRPYLEEYAPNLWTLLQEHEEWAAAVTLADGSIPALPCINLLQNNDAMWINSQWLNTLHLDMPTDPESLTDVLRAFRDSDPNRNGKQDEVPLTFIGMWELRFLGHAFGITDNDYYVSVRDGKVASSLTSDENRAFLSWLHQLWEEKLLDHNGFTTVDTLRQITDSKADIPYGMMLSTTPLTVIPSDSLKQYTLLEPMLCNGKQVYRNLLGEVIPGTFAITSACKDPAKLIAWVESLYTPEGNRMAHYGIENEEWYINADGFWQWTEEISEVADHVLRDNTISDGGVAPGFTDGQFQLTYDDQQTRQSVEQLFHLKTFEEPADPIIYWSTEDRIRLAEIQGPLSAYAETTMAGFVTGDIELNDENWAAFCTKTEESGLSEMISLWQKYVR